MYSFLGLLGSLFVGVMGLGAAFTAGKKDKEPSSDIGAFWAFICWTLSIGIAYATGLYAN